MMNKYEIIIYWSEPDKIFVAEMPELDGCMAHGITQDEALREINIVAEEWLNQPKKKVGKFLTPKEN